MTQPYIHGTICRTGWTGTFRPPASETSPAKFTVSYPAYDIPDGATSELDHLLSGVAA